MEDVTKKIRNYLVLHGKMSGRDICDDCEVISADVEFAASEGAIVSARPTPGGVGSWFRAAD